jgi:hypothetical protein
VSDDWPTWDPSEWRDPPDRFYREYLGVLSVESEDERRLRLAWAAYYLSAELYDRTLPHVMKNGEALPHPGWPMAACQRNARHLRKWMLRFTRLIERRLGSEVALRIRDHVCGLSFEALRRMVYDETQGDGPDGSDCLTPADCQMAGRCKRIVCWTCPYAEDCQSDPATAGCYGDPYNCEVAPGLGCLAAK